MDGELRDGPPTAIFAGRLLPLKGVALGIRAVALTENWRFLIVGDGPDKTRLQRLTRELRLADRVDFLEWQPRDELMAIMRRADTLLFPSLHDEAGWVVAEAMACGLTVVCLDRGGPPVLAGEGAGVAAAGGQGKVVSRLAAGLESRVQAEEMARGSPMFRARAELSMEAVSDRVAHVIDLLRVGAAQASTERRRAPVAASIDRGPGP
jgi:glycosyltransferase involved in cell wall biosynthesis